MKISILNSSTTFPPSFHNMMSSFFILRSFYFNHIHLLTLITITFLGGGRAGLSRVGMEKGTCVQLWMYALGFLNFIFIDKTTS